MSAVEDCTVCAGGVLRPLRHVADVAYLRCDGCGTILAERGFLDRIIAGKARSYDAGYWANELSAARERGYGASLIRLAEVFLHARRPVRRFLDVSCGAGTLLDAAAELLPENRAILESARFGHFLLASGIEGARCYLESAMAGRAVGELRRQASLPPLIRPGVGWLRQAARRLRTSIGG